ncbi:MAG: helix-turn-helix transcriptional regulator [Clostridia bacterium]|nr:helix-turn-helix transcriptional regulator [Clostridia bacterium]
MTETLAGRIRLIIGNLQMTQAEFAQSLGVSANYISLLATNKKKNVSLTFAKLVESLYGYSAQWVLYGEAEGLVKKDPRRQLVNAVLKMPEEKLVRLEEFIQML